MVLLLDVLVSLPVLLMASQMTLHASRAALSVVRWVRGGVGVQAEPGESPAAAPDSTASTAASVSFADRHERVSCGASHTQA